MRLRVPTPCARYPLDSHCATLTVVSAVCVARSSHSTPDPSAMSRLCAVLLLALACVSAVSARQSHSRRAAPLTPRHSDSALVADADTLRANEQYAHLHPMITQQWEELQPAIDEAMNGARQ